MFATYENQIFFSTPLPPLGERQEIINIIRDQWNITPEQFNEILNQGFLVYRPGKFGGIKIIEAVNDEPECFEYGFSGALDREQNINDRKAQREHERNVFEISQALTWPENMEITLKFADQNINVTSPKIREDIFNLLKAMKPPVEPPAKAKRGHPSNVSIKELKTDKIRFLSRCLPPEMTPGDKLFFCALSLAYMGIIETPKQSGENLTDYRKKFTDQLRHYSK